MEKIQVSNSFMLMLLFASAECRRKYSSGVTFTSGSNSRVQFFMKCSRRLSDMGRHAFCAHA